MKQKCKIAACDREISYPAYGWCFGHYHRFIRNGDPGDTPVRKQKNHLKRYLEKQKNHVQAGG